MDSGIVHKVHNGVDSNSGRHVCALGGYLHLKIIVYVYLSGYYITDHRSVCVVPTATQPNDPIGAAVCY